MDDGLLSISAMLKPGRSAFTAGPNRGPAFRRLPMADVSAAAASNHEDTNTKAHPRSAAPGRLWALILPPPRRGDVPSDPAGGAPAPPATEGATCPTVDVDLPFPPPTRGCPPSPFPANPPGLAEHGGATCPATRPAVTKLPPPRCWPPSPPATPPPRPAGPSLVERDAIRDV